jgi:hypothetical protein
MSNRTLQTNTAVQTNYEINLSDIFNLASDAILVIGSPRSVNYDG